MRLIALTAFVLCVAGCGATATKPTHKPRRGDDGGEVFGRGDKFAPTAFAVDVEGEGRPVILIPGLGCPGEVWEEVVAHLTKHGYETHTLTLAGFAGQPTIDEPLSQAARRDLTRYIRAKKLKHPIIVGHSMGGFIAYWIASYHPELVGPVIIVDASPALSGDLDEAKALRDKWRKADDDVYFAQVRSAFMSMTHHAERMKPIIDLIVKSDRKAIGDAIFEMMQTDLTDAVKEIKAPVLIIAADGGLKQRIIAQTATIPDHQVVVVPRAAHFVMWDEPKAFFAAMDTFLDAHVDDEPTNEDRD
ncbi:MAG TPA: alpha/beta hydrolase [Kofleriaceae bacterium]|jgi:pimeloyl-ACP methyl ester carboxylesterase